MVHRTWLVPRWMFVMIMALVAASLLTGTREGARAAAVPGDTVYGWGLNRGSELGPHPAYTTSVYVKVHVPAGVRVTSLAVGSTFSLALASNGDVYGWGDDSIHQLGLSLVNTISCICTPTPVRIPFPTGVRIKAIASGWEHSLALASDGRIYGWGDNQDGQLGKKNPGTRNLIERPTLIPLPGGVRARAIATGWAHSLALGVDGHLYAWGLNIHGQLGTGARPTGNVDVDRSDLPVRVRFPRGVKITDIAVGEQQNLALASDGSIYAWGLNADGQVGDGTTTDRDAPVRVTLPGNARAITVAAGYDHSLAIASNGNAYQWGVYQVRLGPTTVRAVGKPVPTRVKLPAGVTARGIAAGEEDFSLVRGSGGALYAWGDNTYGALGDGSTTSSVRPVRVHMPLGVSGRKVAAGGFHSLVLGSDGALYAWGLNRSAQLGGGDLLQSSLPIPIRGLAGVRVKAVSGDVFLRSDGTVQTWGQRPLWLPGKARAATIATGYSSALALASNGRVYAWGFNGVGQLGNGSTARSSRVPVKVRLPSGVRATAIAVGGGFDLAVTSTGAVYAWGDNTFGELGTGDTKSSNVPVPVHLPSGVRVTAVAAEGAYQSLAVASGGAVYIWGRDSQLDVIGATAQHCGNGLIGGPCLMTPARLRLPSGFRARGIAAGPEYGLVVGSGGAVYGWGSNLSGQLGIGSATSSGVVSTPERVHLPAGVRAVTIAAGWNDSMAITASGAAYGWGANDAGQLGIGRVSRNACRCVSTPARVHLPTGLRTVSVALSVDHTLAVTSPR